jgi:hypothetical protein
VGSRFYGFPCVPVLVISTAQTWHWKVGPARGIIAAKRVFYEQVTDVKDCFSFIGLGSYC